MTDRDETASEEAIRAWARLVRVTQSLLRAVEADMKARGFPPLPWYDALLELRRAGPDGLRAFELQNEMLLAQYNMSRLVARLLGAGYIRAEVCERDRRGQVLCITRDGEGLLRRMWPVYRQAIHRHFAGRIDDNDAERLASILAKLV